MNLKFKIIIRAGIAILIFCTVANGEHITLEDNLYDMGQLKPFDSELKIKSGMIAPDFTLPSVSGKEISLGQYKNKKNIVLSFVPAAFTPVCSNQWPGYNVMKDLYDQNDAVLLGISVDNIPTLFAWTRQMGDLWFEVLSDFWPHGMVADQYGVLRSDGLTERALFFIDKEGIVRSVLMVDINRMPDEKTCAAHLEKLK